MMPYNVSFARFHVEMTAILCHSMYLMKIKMARGSPVSFLTLIRQTQYGGC